MLSFVPAGKLRLYRLGERTRFPCVRCLQDKTAIFVATEHGDWNKTVCSDCYDSLVPSRRETEKAAARQIALAKQPSVMAKPKKSAKIKPKNKQDPIQLTTKREQQLLRSLPGVDRVLSFFRDSGVRIEVRHGGRLLINGSETPPLTWTLPKRIDWDDVIDELALKYVGGKFLKAVEDNARFGKGFRAFLRRREKGFVIMHGDVQLATIHASSARIPHRDAIHGNFLMPGPHWPQLADIVDGAETELVAKWNHEQEAKAAAEAAIAEAEAEQRRAAARRRLDHLPNSLPPELINACLEASRRIRLERQVAYDQPVVLESGFDKLTLLPVIATTTRLLMPFRFNNEGTSLTGELVLGDCDPLPLQIGEDVADQDAITAWTCALLGFADATCVQFELVEPTGRREPTSPQGRTPSSVSCHRPSTRTLPRKRWPQHLEPVGRWLDYSGAFVAGHRRRLSDGQTASADARDRALEVGIILLSRETWVRPHTRGVPDGVEMRFLWHAPIELKLSTT
jgi:hypothetical protein